ncbi:MAG: nickel-dependent hydrogenase large subunit [Pseudomonadota bacterium]
MAKTVIIDPISRIEGHLAVRVEIESKAVKNAYCSGEMFRGFEVILKGRDPLDAQQITQRICGVCPVSHGIASVLAQDMAYRASVPSNGKLARNLILGANYIQSHLTHFYHLSALDFIDIQAITGYLGKDPALNELKDWVKVQISSGQVYPGAPFLPRYLGGYVKSSDLNITAIKHYLEAFDFRSMAQRAGAIFCGKLPHAASLVPGGVTEKIDSQKILAYRTLMQQIRTFIVQAYLPDVMAVAASFPEYFRMGKGCGNFLAFGVFREPSGSQNTFFPSGTLVDGRLTPFNPDFIREYTQYSLFSSPTGLEPSKGESQPDPKKQGAYSWIKAPRYNGQVMEVGPLARILVSLADGKNQTIVREINNFLKDTGQKPENMVSVMGRHAARAIECKLVADQCLEWVEQLIPGRSAFTDFEIPESTEGIGLTEAPRGALGHWLQIRDKKISRYQCVVPTTWNCSPRDDQGVPGPVEQALVGTPVSDDRNPLEATRVVRSFDPCIACAVH